MECVNDSSSTHCRNFPTEDIIKFYFILGPDFQMATDMANFKNVKAATPGGAVVSVLRHRRFCIRITDMPFYIK